MSFTHSLDTAIGQIRLEVGDTEQDAPNGVRPPALTNFSDEELTYFYQQEAGNVLAAAARACEVLARLWARSGKSVKIRDYSIDSRDRAAAYRDLAKDLREKSGTLFASGSAPTTRVDGNSSDVNSQETQAGGPEYWNTRPVTRWP